MFCCVCAYKCLKISLLSCTYYVVCGSMIFYLNCFAVNSISLYFYCKVLIIRYLCILYFCVGNKIVTL